MKISRTLQLFALLALCATTAWASMSARYEVSDYVSGVSDSATVKIYVNTGAEGYAIYNFGLKWTLPDGVTATAVEAGDCFDSTANKTMTISSDKKTVVTMVAPKIGTAAIPAKSDDQLFATITLAIDPALTGTLSLTVAAQGQLRGLDTATDSVKSYTAGKDCTFETALSVHILESFNFYANDGATFVTDEDTAITIDPNDTDKFTCKAWDGTTLVASTAKFTAAQADNGTAKVSKGKITLTPPADFNGDIVVTYTVASTDASISSTIDGSLTVTVNPVDDPPVVTWQNVTPKNEGGFLEGDESDDAIASSVVTIDDIDSTKLEFLLCWSLSDLSDDEVKARVESGEYGDLHAHWEAFFPDLENGHVEYDLGPMPCNFPYDTVAHPDKSATVFFYLVVFLMWVLWVEKFYNPSLKAKQHE